MKLTNIFLVLTPKAQAAKGKKGKWDPIRLTGKLLTRKRQPTEWETVFKPFI